MTEAARIPSNLVRLDFGEVTFFLSTFRNPDAIHAHAHEDSLSYVVYRGADEVLIDPGLASYTRADAGFRSSGAHNGLADPDRPVAPRRRFFFNRALRAEPGELDISRGADGARLTAANRLLGIRREISISRVAAGTVRVEERLSGAGTLRPRFVHNYPDLAVETVGNDSVLLGGGVARIAYENLSVSLATAERSREYGRRQPHSRLAIGIAPSPSARVVWALSWTVAHSRNA